MKGNQRIKRPAKRKRKNRGTDVIGGGGGAKKKTMVGFLVAFLLGVCLIYSQHCLIKSNCPFSSKTTTTTDSIDKSNVADKEEPRKSPSLDEANRHFPPLPFDIWTRQEENKFLFLHVGKAGGSTIFCNFVVPRLEEFKSDVNFWCRNMKPATAEEMANPPVYSQKYGKRLHMTKMDDDTVTQYNAFLVSLRNPITRIISAYDYEKSNKNRWVQKSYPAFKQCFPNSVLISDLLLCMDENITSATYNMCGMNSSTYCRQLGAKAVKGEIESYRSHMTYNYQFYEDQFLYAVNSNKTNTNTTNTTTTTNHRMLALRIEHLEEDLENLEIFLKTGKVVVANNTGVYTAVVSAERAKNRINVGRSKTGSITSTAYRILCQLLCKDIQSYKRFLFRAENLNKEMILDSMQDLFKYCPTEGLAINEDCE